MPEKILTLTEADNWKGVFKELDECKDGKKIEYSIREKVIGDGYKSVITGNIDTGYVVKNSRTPDTQPVKPAIPSSKQTTSSFELPRSIPQTGDTSKAKHYGFLLGLSIVLLVAVVRIKRNKR